jgi:hypothetical protein
MGASMQTWGVQWDSNPRPPGPQPGVLTKLNYGHHDSGIKDTQKLVKKQGLYLNLSVLLEANRWFVSPTRIERVTYSLEGCCSIQLSYGPQLLSLIEYNLRNFGKDYKNLCPISIAVSRITVKYSIYTLKSVFNLASEE